MAAESGHTAFPICFKIIFPEKKKNGYHFLVQVVVELSPADHWLSRLPDMGGPHGGHTWYRLLVGGGTAFSQGWYHVFAGVVPRFRKGGATFSRDGTVPGDRGFPVVLIAFFDLLGRYHVFQRWYRQKVGMVPPKSRCGTSKK